MRFIVRLAFESEAVHGSTSILGLEEPPSIQTEDLEPVCVEAPGFPALDAASGPPARGVALSLVLHGMAVAALPLFSILLFPIPEPVPVKLVRYETLRIRLPERIHLAERTPNPRPQVQFRNADPSSEGRRVLERKAASPPKPIVPELREAAPEPLPAVAQEPVRRTPRRTIELPPGRTIPNAEFTLIQPEYPAHQPVVATTPPPQLMLWSAQLEKPKRPLKEFVMPGSLKKPPETPKLDAPPELARPNQQIELAQLRFAGQAANLAPNLPVQPANAAPIRRFTPPPAQPPTRAYSLDPFEGEQALVISIPDKAQPLPTVLNLPAGNQISPPGRAISSNAKPGGAQGKDTGIERAASKSPQGSGAGNGSGVPAGGLAGPSLTAGYSVPIRIEHPENSVFDIVVVGAAGTMRDSVNVLSGSPIYTVHLRVGGPRNWVMQYCVPNQRAASKVTGGVVTLGKPSPVKAPFPRITIVPPKELYPAADPITVHGFIGLTGAFHDLRIISGQQAAAAANLLALLDAWTFRPAVRDGSPVEVEMVLLVPPLNTATR